MGSRLTPVRFAATVAMVAAVAGDVHGAVSVTDASGAKVTLEQPARRVVSLAPHATELLFAVGAGETLVGVLAPADWPTEARALPKVGDNNAVDLEAILALRPDLVVTWPYLSSLHVDRLRALGVAVYVSEPRKPADIAEEMRRLGLLTGHEAGASRVAAELDRRIAGIRARYAGAAPVRVFYEIWNQPLYTIGGDHLINAAIELCGGRNIFAAQRLPAPQIGIEAVIAAAPAAIIAATDRAERPAWLDDWRRWPSLPAVAQGNLFVVDANLLHRPGPRFVDGVDQLCGVIESARSRAR
jgi:iron complex transport system substrate-binding protein